MPDDRPAAARGLTPLPASPGVIADPLLAYADLKVRAELGGDLTTEGVFRVVDALVEHLGDTRADTATDLREQVEGLESQIERWERDGAAWDARRHELEARVAELARLADDLARERDGAYAELAAGGYDLSASDRLADAAPSAEPVPAAEPVPPVGPLTPMTLPVCPRRPTGPATADVTGYPVGDLFAVVNVGGRRWEVVHRPTGLRCTLGTLPKKGDAYALVREFLGRGGWDFTEVAAAPAGLVEFARGAARAADARAAGTAVPA